MRRYFKRIRRCAVDADFIVQMRAGALSGVAQGGDDVTAFDLLSPFDQNFIQVGIPGGFAVAVVDGYQVAVVHFFVGK